jgi:hypothetical protein
MTRHNEFDPETNAKLNALFVEWQLADNRAAAYDYGNMDVLYYEDGQRRTMSSQPIADEADNAARLYDTLLANAKKHRQPHQITAGVYNSTLRFDTPENALKFATAVNGEIDGRTVTTQAALVDIDRALIRNDIFGGMIRARSFSPVNMPAFLRMRTAGGAQ